MAVRIFAAIAYRHPYFDGNKRTAFVAALLIGGALGMKVRPFPVEDIEAQVIEMTAREADDAELAAWFGNKVFIEPGKEEGTSR